MTDARTVVHRYGELDDLSYSRFRRRLLVRKGGTLQLSFLQAVREGNAAFLRHLSDIDRLAGEPAPPLPCPLTEFEFGSPPWDTERDIFRRLEDLSPAVACRTAFWASYALDAIKREQIQAVYLAANGGNLGGGAARIDRAIHALGARVDPASTGAKRVDSCVRTVLRRMGGIPEVRGKRTVYVDCPFARAWWREWVVAEVADGDEDMARIVARLLRLSQTYWEKIVDRIVSRNSTFGATEVRRAFLMRLALKVEEVRKPAGKAARRGEAAKVDASPLEKPKQLIRLCRRVSAHQGMRELSVLDPRMLDDLMEEVLVA